MSRSKIPLRFTVSNQACFTKMTGCGFQEEVLGGNIILETSNSSPSNPLYTQNWRLWIASTFRSSGLWRYVSVVLMWEWPIKDWTVLRSLPLSRRVVANVCHMTCGWILFWVKALLPLIWWGSPLLLGLKPFPDRDHASPGSEIVDEPVLSHSLWTWPKFMKTEIFLCNNSKLKTACLVFWHYMFEGS